MKDIAQQRLLSQQLQDPQYRTPSELLRHMGAIQAQDPIMAQWAIGIRLPGIEQKEVLAAIEKGSIIRTHVLRPTWHIVAAENVRWMLRLTAPTIRSSMKGQLRNLEITPEVLQKCFRIFEKALADGRHLRRRNLLAELERAGISVEGQRGAYFLTCAELEEILCSGAQNGRENTFALMDYRVPPAKDLAREEALSKLAEIYFRSHAPATLEDFKWWSGLGIRDARIGVESLGNPFYRENINAREYIFCDNRSPSKLKEGKTHLLPAFDEHIIAYTNRKDVLPQEHMRRAVSVNGIFRPVITQDGMGKGLWKLIKTGNKQRLEFQFFESESDALNQQVREAIRPLAAFLSRGDLAG